jgi:hypothetical protein
MLKLISLTISFEIVLLLLFFYYGWYEWIPLVCLSIITTIQLGKDYQKKIKAN